MTDTVEITEESHYYPFGLKHSGYNENTYTPVPYNYKYNGKELQETGGSAALGDGGGGVNIWKYLNADSMGHRGGEPKGGEDKRAMYQIRCFWEISL